MTATASRSNAVEGFRDGVPPAIPAYVLRSTISIAFWCPWCRRVHSHGAGGGDGGRVSHCDRPGSPLKGIGYDLLYVGEVRAVGSIPRLTKGEFIQLSNRLTARGELVGGWKP
jgi:hypothetical protein